LGALGLEGRRLQRDLGLRAAALAPVLELQLQDPERHQARMGHQLGRDRRALAGPELQVAAQDAGQDVALVVRAAGEIERLQEVGALPASGRFDLGGRADLARGLLRFFLRSQPLRDRRGGHSTTFSRASEVAAVLY